jgi:hypothetical protein
MAGERTAAGKQKSRDSLTPIPLGQRAADAQQTVDNVRSGNMTAQQGIRRVRSQLSPEMQRMLGN